MSTQIVTGPSTSKVSKAEAETKLRAHPKFPKNASITLEDVDGKWVAAVTSAEPPSFGDDESKPKEDKSSEGGNPFDKGDDSSSSDDSSSDKPEGDSSDDAPSFDGDGPDGPSPEGDADADKGGDPIAELSAKVDQLMQALGIDPAGHDPHGLEPDPAAAGGDPLAPGSEGGPADLPAPPDDLGGGAGTPAAPGGAKHIVHEHALKPGETPPGGTPLGAPSFSSVQIPNDHPWREAAVAGTSSFVVEERIGSAPLSEIHAEVSEYARQAGYRVHQIEQSNDAEGFRTAKVLIGK